MKRKPHYFIEYDFIENLSFEEHAANILFSTFPVLFLAAFFIAYSLF